jgi:hypothetical protein
MNVRTSNIVGMVAGFVFGSSFSIQLEWLSLMIAGIMAINILFAKKQFLKGPFWGLIAGVLLGYSLHTFFLLL